jgi:hypothetical protein
MRVDLKDPDQLTRLVDQFFGYIEPQIEGFEKAVDEFKNRVNPSWPRRLTASAIAARWIG